LEEKVTTSPTRYSPADRTKTRLPVGMAGDIDPEEITKALTPRFKVDITRSTVKSSSMASRAHKTTPVAAFKIFLMVSSFS
jgi:hypothetical protein